MDNGIKVAALVGILFLAACSTKPKLANNQRGPRVTPAGTEQAPRVAPGSTIKRTLVANVVVDPELEAQLQAAGLYTPDNCVQLVTWEENGRSRQMLEFTPWVNCQGGELAPAEDAARGFALDFQRTGPGNYQAYHQQSGTVYGDIQTLMHESRGIAYTLLNLCQYGQYSSYADTCTVHIENGQYRGLERFIYE